MRVSIEHGTETSGIFKKTTYYTVAVNVQFSEEEAAILKKADLMDHIVMERGLPPNRRDIGEPDMWNLRVKDLSTPKHNLYVFNTTAEAKRYEEEVMERMQDVKAAIEEHRDVKVESKTYEL